jgi:putative ABC transport system permease protein
VTRLWAIVALAISNGRRHRVQAALIAVTLAASGGLLTFGLTARAASGNAWDRLSRATNGADLWLYLDASRVTPTAVDAALTSTPGVAGWSPPTPDLAVSPVGVTQPGFGGGFVLREWPIDPHSVGHPVLVDGHIPNRGEPDVVALDLNVSRTLHLPIGSAFVVPTANGIHRLRVVGLQANAERCPYPLCTPQTLYVGPGTLDALGVPARPAPHQLENAVPVRVAQPTPDRVEAVRDALTRELPAGSVGYVSLASDSRAFGQLGYATQGGLLLSFAVVGLLAAALLIVVAIGGAVRADSRRIGLLKAVGCSAADLRVAVLAEYVGIGFLGALGGALVACMLAPVLLASVSDEYGSTPLGMPWGAGVTATAVATVATAAVVLVASRRVIRIDTVTALRSESAHGSRAFPLLRGPVVIGQAIVDIAASRGRSLFTGLALAIAAASLVFALLMSAGFGYFTDQLAFDGARAGDLVAQSSGQLPLQRALSIFHAQPGVVGVVRERMAAFTFPGSSKNYNLRLRAGDTAALPQALASGRQVERPGEVVIGYALAQQHGLRLGDRLTVLVDGTIRALPIVGINHELNNLGQMATTLTASLYTPDAPSGSQPLYLARVAPGANAAAIASRVQAASGGVINASPIGASSIPPILRSIGPVIDSLAAGLALLTVLGVFNAVYLGVQERRRHFGHLRALGMTRGQVLATGIAPTVALAVIACLVAVPLASLGGKSLLSTFQGGLGIGPLSMPVPATVLAVIPAVIAIAILGALGPAWLASRTSVTSVVREL